MDDEAIQQFINEIDRLPHIDEPRSRMFSGHPSPYVFVEGNKAALLRFGRHFLAAAVAPEVTRPNELGRAVDVTSETLKQVIHPTNCIGIGWIRRVPTEMLTEESIDRDTHRIARTGLLLKLGCGLVVCFLLFLFVSGIILWIVVLAGDLR